MKKYELTSNFVVDIFGKKLFQIKATVDFGAIKKGEKGGYIEKESNLAQSGNAWVADNALVSGNARVSGNAEVAGDAEVSGDADYLCIKGIGSEFRNTTAYKSKNGIEVNCGCFFGTLQDFETKVKQTHGDSKFAKEYNLFIDMIKLHFDVEGEASND